MSRETSMGWGMERGRRVVSNRWGRESVRLFWSQVSQSFSQSVRLRASSVVLPRQTFLIDKTRGPLLPEVV
jgi:hypothetical protein